MKNAKVLQDHVGDNGHVTAGMILTDVTTKRFDELEKKGLIREATDAEVEAGDQHDFQADESASGDDAGEKRAEKPANKKAAEPANKSA